VPAKSSPLFSIIVPAYNVENYISECIESVLSQSFQDFELILIDDGSTDQTGKICDKYQKESAGRLPEDSKNQPQPSIVSQIGGKVNTSNAKPLVSVIHQQNSGLSEARNAGIARASGEYLILLDGDDYLESGALKAIKNGLETGLDLLRYQAQEVFTDGKIMKYQEVGFAATPGVAAFRKLARYHYTENAWLYAYRREFFVQNNFQYAKGCIAEDFGLTPLIIAKAKAVKAIPDICYSYRQREGSIMHDAAKLARRTADIEKQLGNILPKIAKILGAEPILHYLVVSFLTETVRQDQAEFLEIYQRAKKSGMLKYVHPASLRAVPRSLLLRFFPKIFYRVYRRSIAA